MALVDALVCPECGRSFPGDDGPRTCPAHDGGATLSVRYDRSTVAETLDSVGGVGESIWQFEPILPTGTGRVRLGAGGTPLLDAPSISRDLGVSLALKDETGNPTGSIKDRSSAVLVSRAASAGAEIGCASTGNQATSVAAYAARAGLECRVFVPGDVPDGKAVQPLLSGADVYAVDGDYDDAAALCRQVSADRGWRDCTAGVDPFGLEGLRTVGHEIALARRECVPDWVVVPVGNGTGLAATWKGLRECREYGVVDRAPRMLGVQAAGAAAVHRQFTGEDVDAGATAAHSIDVGDPHDVDRACAALDASDGASVAVSDEAIFEAEWAIGRLEGLHAEPASAATVAGLRRALSEGIVEAGADVVCVITGGGVTDAEGSSDLVDDVERIPPAPSAVPGP